MVDSSAVDVANPVHIDTEEFEREGYVIAHKLVPPTDLAAMRGVALGALKPLLGPAEFESETDYPGAPTDADAPGGETPRRLLHAFPRHAMYRRWAMSKEVVGRVRRYLGVEAYGPDSIRLSQCHHNCVMTKHPGYSSATLWHQDIRYWSFDRPELISVWFALGDEREANGALSVIPSTHELNPDRGRLDRDYFLRPELVENRALIDKARQIELDAGDVMFFHCNLFHAAGRNRTGTVKLSLVFTYHAGDNQPIPGTRSARYPSINVG